MSGDHIHPEPTTFLAKYIFSKDHKVIAKQFMWLGFAWLLVGGTMAMMIRWQLAYPGRAFPLLGHLLYPRSGGVIPPDGYNTLFTMHGTIMIFLGLTPTRRTSTTSWGSCARTSSRPITR